MALLRWKWVDYLNIELYEHNLDRSDAQEEAKAPVYYDSDEEIFFDRLNHNKLMLFWENRNHKVRSGTTTTDPATGAASAHAAAILHRFYDTLSASRLSGAELRPLKPSQNYLK
jgi:hypothetical protein